MVGPSYLLLANKRASWRLAPAGFAGWWRWSGFGERELVGVLLFRDDLSSDTRAKITILLLCIILAESAGQGIIIIIISNSTRQEGPKRGHILLY